jgi:hypothetical protein
MLNFKIFKTKKIINLKSLIFLLSAVLFTISCENDESTKNNSFNYSGNDYETNNAMAVNYGVGNSGACYFKVAISLNELNYNAEDGWFTGSTQQCIYFELYSDTKQEIAPGDYSGASNYDAYTIETGECFLFFDYDFNNGSGNAIEASKASLTVRRDGNDYIFEYQFNFDGKTVNGYYKGNIEIIDLSD